MSPAEAERRIVVAALIERRLYGAAARELVIRRAGLGRVDGYAALVSLERSGGVWDDVDGVAVGWFGRMLAGLPDPPPAPYDVEAADPGRGQSPASADADRDGFEEAVWKRPFPDRTEDAAGGEAVALVPKAAPSLELVTCSSCGNTYELGERQARAVRRGAIPRCFDCRYPNRLPEPTERERRWVERLDEGTRERVLDAVAALF